MAQKSGQAGFEIGFIVFSLFYFGFVTYAAAAWPGASGTVTGSLSVPTLPAQPGILDYLSFVFVMAWFYVTAFLGFNINIPVLGLITTVIALTMVFIVARLIRGTA